MAPRPRARLTPLHPVLAVLAAGAMTVPATAQSIGGSESTTSLARAIVGSGGTGAATGGSLEFALAPVAGPVATSESFTLVPTVVWTEPLLGTDGPVLFGSVPPAGAAAGGEVVVLRGLNFTATGAGITDVTFAGQAANAVTVLGPSTIQATTPAGVDGFGNPLGAVEIELSNGLGSASGRDDFLFTPAVHLYSPAQLGDPLAVRLRTAPGALAFLWFGVDLGGPPPIPLPGFDGSVALLLAQTVVAAGAFLPTGELTVPLAVPDQPSLAGAVLDFQGLAITDLFGPAGSFTNVLDVPITD